MTIVGKLLQARKAGIIRPEVYAGATEVVIGALYHLTPAPGMCHWCGKAPQTIQIGEVKLCASCAGRLRER